MVYRRRRIAPLKKRGLYFEASAGRNVPFVGGSSVKLGTRGIKKLIRRTALKTEETKKLVEKIAAAGQLKHETIYTGKLINIAQGTTGTNRVGDKIFLCGITLKGLIQNFNSAVAYQKWRLYVIRTRDIYAGLTGTSLGSGIGSTTMFRNNDTSPIGLLNSDNMTIVCSKTLNVNPHAGSGEFGRPYEFRMNCRIMKDYQFKTGATDGEFHNYYLVVLPYSQTTGQQVTGTTAMADLYLTHEVVYKDS